MNSFPCYIHIEKCAGTTLHHALRYNLPGYVVLRPWYYWSNDPNNYFTSNELKLLKVMLPILSGIGGHTTRSYLDYASVLNKPVSYFTFLRNPIDRYLSHYNHQVNKMEINWSIEDFIAEKKFDNFITRRISGSDDLELAKEMLTNKYNFIGLFERFNESLVMLSHYVFDRKLTLLYEHKNDSSGESKLSFSELSKVNQENLIKANQLDLKLYDYVVEKLYQRQIENYGADLLKNHEDYCKKNSIYKYNYIKKSLVQSSRIITDFLIQNLVHKISNFNKKVLPPSPNN